MSDIEIYVFPVSAMQSNCAILKCRNTNSTVLIDPGGDAERIISMLKEHQCRLEWILLTHAHFDHCQVAAEVIGDHQKQNHPDEHPLRVAMHPADRPVLEHLAEQQTFFGQPRVGGDVNIINYELQDNEEIQFGQALLKVIHTPGHSPGSCCFLVESLAVLFSGDTLFARSVGRTDLPGGDMDQLVNSIKNRLFPLNEMLKIIPGHGPLTLLREEKIHNPFVGEGE